jgi:hypothetical protein
MVNQPRPFDPLRAVGVVFEPNVGNLGSCFGFRRSPYLLTAAHCVKGMAPGRVGVLMPGHNEDYIRVTDVRVHPEADVAVLKADGSRLNPELEVFWDTVANWGMGEDFMAYGYPEDAPAPRLFKGYFMRFMDHKSHMGYRYLAGEINIPVPTGLSGGPLFREAAPPMVTALVAENFSSYLVDDSTESIEEGGTRSRTEIRRVVSYGVVVMLSAIRDWLDSEVAPRTYVAGGWT